MTSHALWVDPNPDLSPEDLEKVFYACMAQLDLTIEAMNAKMSVEQLVVTKEAEAKAKAVAEAAAALEVVDDPQPALNVPPSSAEAPQDSSCFFVLVGVE